MGISYTTQDTSASVINSSDDFYSKVKIYDGNGVEESYSIEELKEFIKFTPNTSNANILSNNLLSTSLAASDWEVYSTGAFNFQSDIWIGGGWRGKAFYNPVDTLITPKGTAKDFKIECYYDKDGGAGDTAKIIEFPGGWTGTIHVSAWSNLPRGYKYRFHFVNTSKDKSKLYFDNVSVLYD